MQGFPEVTEIPGVSHLPLEPSSGGDEHSDDYFELQPTELRVKHHLSPKDVFSGRSETSPLMKRSSRI